MPISAILWWLAIVALLGLIPVSLLWPGLRLPSRLFAVGACVSAGIALVLGSALLLVVFGGCFALAALIAQVDPHRRTRTEWRSLLRG